MTRKIVYAVVALVVLALSYTSFTGRTDLYVARAQLQGAQALARAALQNKVYADARADSAEARAEAAEARRAAQAPVRAAIVAAAPDTCKPAIAALQAEIVDVEDALTAQKEAAAALRGTNEDLTGVVRSYGDAADKILKATKPSFLDHLLPDVGVGAAAGIDPASLKPATVVGLTLSWDI